ncbi:RING finger protein 166-like [Centruroides sculpturatus]|uniref:RING finger protein 166-like n=1 Tax=Centruroides sculpturatus TaxID=218467 RepID=UPI000C6E333A|nr:RING finger protein 166-like [Centruroides sculpturatus]
MSKREVINQDTVTCSVCLEIYREPVTICCGHVFCKVCITSVADIQKKEKNSSTCPLCRVTFDLSKIKKATDIQKQISSHNGSCPGCQETMCLSRLRNHMNKCKKVSPNEKTPSLPENITMQSCSAVPNRKTFPCPYCEMKNFDLQSLREHCNRNHEMETESVVCPVCASMPWGNPDQRSIHFISHLNYRHKFEYDTFMVSDIYK